jgi:hypothetical protein
MKKLLTAGVAITVAMTSAFAADMPVKAPQAIAAGGGFYFLTDGSYQSIHLPTYDGGIRLNRPNVGAPAANVIGDPAASFDPRAKGFGLSGGVGYVLPYGVIPAAFGSNARIEIGGSYVKATATQNSSTVTLPTGEGYSIVLLNGLHSSGFTAGSFPIISALSTDYKAWQGHLKGASDFKFGLFTVTPSIAFVGGKATNNQGLSQQTFDLGVLAQTYTENSTLSWTDWGGKFGLNTNFDVTNWMTLGLGGTLGFASRDVSLSANDAIVGLGSITPSSAIAVGTRTTAFLANAEASATFRPSSAVALKTFVGLNYDSKVPGISASTPGPGALVPAAIAGQQGTPADIKFTAETNWYAGGGLVVKFAP